MAEVSNGREKFNPSQRGYTRLHARGRPDPMLREKPKQLHRLVCECTCGPVVEVDPDTLGGVRCIKCGRSAR